METPPPAPPAAPAPRRRVRVRDLVLPVVLSLGTLAVILWLTYDAQAFSAVASRFRPGVFALAVGAVLANFVMGGMRIRHVSAGLLSAKQSVRGQVTWDFLSAITPSAMGGAPFAAYFIARFNGLPVGRVTAVLLFLILMDQLWFIVAIVASYVAAVWIPVFPTSLGAVGIGTVALYLGGVVSWITFFMYATLIRPEILESVIGRVMRFRWLRRFEPTVRAEARKMRRQAQSLRGKPFRFYAIGGLYTLGVWALRYTIVFLAALTFSDVARPVLYVFRTIGLWLVGIAMPTPGGAGGMEGLFMLFLAPLLPDGAGGPTVLLWRLVSYHFILVVGAFVAGAAVRAMLAGEGPTAGDPEAAEPEPTLADDLAAELGAAAAAPATVAPDPPPSP